MEEVEAATLRPHVDLDYFVRAHRILRDAADRAQSRLKSLQDLIDRCHGFAEADFSMVYDKGRDLLHIGYNLSDRRLDAGYYDLLASEMRLGSFVLVATGQFPQEHWFSLGRQITTSGSYSALLSWSGSMFEYLMPLLIMPTYEGTLLDQTHKGVVNRQMEYAKQRGGRAVGRPARAATTRPMPSSTTSTAPSASPASATSAASARTWSSPPMPA